MTFYEKRALLLELLFRKSGLSLPEEHGLGLSIVL